MTTLMDDLERFPGRRFVRGYAEKLAHKADASHRLEHIIATRWSALLGVRDEEMLLFATVQEAIRAAVHVLTAPAEVILLAQPIAPFWPLSILSAGRQFVDVGRRLDDSTDGGTWDHDAAHRAALAHPQAIALFEAPSWLGTDDTQLVPSLPVRGSIADLTRSELCAGPVLPRQRATLTLVALRDPDAPAVPVLYALVGPEGGVHDVGTAVGPTAVPDAVAERAVDVLHGLAETPQWGAQYLSWLAEREAQWHAALAGRPGVRVYGRCGVEATVVCRAGDGAEVAASLREAFPTVLAWPLTPMRGIVTAELLR